MKTGYQWVLWSALAILVITAVTMLTVITELSLFKATPFIYTAILYCHRHWPRADDAEPFLPADV